jgi:Fic family protein
MYHGLDRLKNNFPLSLRLVREIHGVLLSGGRGMTKHPGEFRQSQNWIGGTRPGNALYVPPPVSHLTECLSDFEKFLHSNTVPTLIKAGLAHVQFETIHPFLDGNGRLGRLLIILLLCDGKILDEPILYLSLYFKKHRATYYDLLQRVRLKGTWEAWLEFFLEGILTSAQQALNTIKEYLKHLPQVSVPLLKELEMTAPTARSALNHMVSLGILKEISGLKRDKVYVYRDYLAILERGTEPL